MPVQVVVIGGGLAGLSSALEAFCAAANVTIIEKESTLVGNSQKATSGINLLAPDSAGGHGDSYQTFYDDVIESAGGLSFTDPSLVHTLCERAQTARLWLRNQAQITLDKVLQCGGHSYPRTYRLGSGRPVGFGIIKVSSSVFDQLQDLVRMHSLNSNRLLSIETNDKGHVCGISVQRDDQEAQIPVDALVLTTGGYSGKVNDHQQNSVMQRLDPFIPGDMPSTNGGRATGVALALAENVGAVFVGTEYVQIHPTGFVGMAANFWPRKP